MRGFDPKLDPSLIEIGIDRLQVQVKGTFALTNGSFGQFAETLLHQPDLGWFNRPGGTGSFRSVDWSARAQSSIREMSATLRSTTQNRGTAKLEATLNPTATMAHCIKRYQAERPHSSFLDYLRGLPPGNFFALADDAQEHFVQSLDGRDNWLPPPSDLGELMDRDYWPAYLAIFVAQLRQLVLQVFSEPQNVSVSTSGARDTVRSSNGWVEIEWDRVSVPQIECYFERFHSTATLAVRRGGWAVLSADHSAHLKRYIGNARFERDNDRLSVSVPLTDTRWLSIYAKLADRMRFEVVRKGKGDYSALPLPEAPIQRLFEIIALERGNTLVAVRWPSIGELFAGPDYPDIHDLQVLIRHIARAAGDNETLLSDLMTKLLYDGSIEERWAISSREHRTATSALKAAGVLEKNAIRRRDMSKTGRQGRRPRLHLTAGYRDIHILFTDPLLQV